jgi:hypothetical protein
MTRKVRPPLLHSITAAASRLQGCLKSSASAGSAAMSASTIIFVRMGLMYTNCPLFGTTTFPDGARGLASTQKFIRVDYCGALP